MSDRAEGAPRAACPPDSAGRPAGFLSLVRAVFKNTYIQNYLARNAKKRPVTIRDEILLKIDSFSDRV